MRARYIINRNGNLVWWCRSLNYLVRKITWLKNHFPFKEQNDYRWAIAVRSIDRKYGDAYKKFRILRAISDKDMDIAQLQSEKTNLLKLLKRLK